MRTLKLELKNTKMNGDRWSFDVNGRSIAEHITNMLEQGTFIGDITITIKQTAEVEPEPDTEEESF